MKDETPTTESVEFALRCTKLSFVLDDLKKQESSDMVWVSTLCIFLNEICEAQKETDNALKKKIYSMLFMQEETPKG